MSRDLSSVPSLESGISAFKNAERSQLVGHLKHYRSMRDEWIRRQVLVNDRVDILATQVLGYQVQPMHFAIMQNQLKNRESLSLAYRGSGKCFEKGTKVLMFDGSLKNVEHVELGDQVMGPDSKPRNVLNLSHGVDKLYRIVPQKGEPWVCNSNHILSLKGRGAYAGEVRNFTLREYVSIASGHKRGFKDIAWKQYRAGVNFPKKDLPIDPYFFGVWLGDGNRDGNPSINCGDQEVHDWIHKNYDGVNGYKVTDVKLTGSPNCKRSYVGTSAKKSNPILNYLRSLGRKFIPSVFLLNSRGNRLKLLAGLLDTDGYYDENKKGYEIIQKSKELANQIAFLARSLGYAAYVNSKIGTIKELDFKCEYWRVSISGNMVDVPCLVERKKAKERVCAKDVLVVGISIERAGIGEYYGFEVDGDHRFLLADFTVVHNSTTGTVTKAIHWLLKNPNFRIMIASKSISNAQGFLKEIKGHFETNERLAELFGLYYDPRKVSKWNDSEIEVLPRTKNYKEASITTVSVEGTIVSKHYDGILSDDLVDEDNSRTQYIRDKVKTWFYQTLEPTLEPPDPDVPHRGEHHMLGTRYHFADLYGHLIENELKEKHIVIPALKDGKSPWPEKHPPKWFEEKRKKSGLIIFNCHSEDTLFYTDKGFKEFDDVNTDDKLLTFNTEKDKFEFQTFTAKLESESKVQEMYLIRNKKLNAMVTPDHRILYRPGERQDLASQSWKYTTAKKLYEDVQKKDPIHNLFFSLKRKSKILDFPFHFYHTEKNEVRKVEYKGRAVCFTVPNGTLVTSRRRKVLVSGNCQYQCSTEAMKGEVFQYDDCQRIQPGEIPDGLRIFMGIDLAISEDSKADHFAIAVIGIDTNKNYYVLDWYDGQLRFNQQTEKIIQFYKKWNPIRACIETNGYQKAQYQNLKEEDKDIRLIPKHQDKDKTARAWKMSSIFEDKRMFFSQMGGVELMIEQLVLFPNYRYKDFFDALDLALTASKLRKKKRRRSEPGLL